MATMLPGSGAPAPLSPWKALAEVLTDPVQAFRRLGSRPPIFPAYFLQMITGAIAFVIMYPYTMQLVNEQYTKMAVDPSMIPTMKVTGLIVGVVSVLATPWVAGLVLGAISLFFAQFHAGSTSFSALFGMIGYARVPLALSTLLSAAGTLMGNKPLNLSLSALLPADVNGPLQGLLSMLNPFGIWYYVLLGIGYATLLGKPMARGTIFAGVLFGISALLAMGSTGISIIPAMP